jgi:hypothetical protein
MVTTRFASGTSGATPAAQGTSTQQAICVENCFQCEVVVQLESKLQDDASAVPINPSIACYDAQRTTFDRTQRLDPPPRRKRRRQTQPQTPGHVLNENPTVHVGSCPDGEPSPYRVTAAVSVRATHAPGGMPYPNASWSDSTPPAGAELFVE